MTVKSKPRFDADALEEMAGDVIFARGLGYFRDGLVEILSVEADKVTARVAGTHDYSTVISGSGDEIDGACSCPAFEREGFCKHMVALALAVNASDVPDTPSGAPKGEGEPGIRDYLRAKGLEALVEMVVELAWNNPPLRQKLEVGAALMGADDKALEAKLRSAIRDATRTGGYVDYRNLPDWASAVETALDLLGESTQGSGAARAADLALYAIDRIEDALQEVDDSRGYCASLLSNARQIHLAAVKVAKPDPVLLAQELFEREMEEEYETFHQAAAAYAQVLGPAGSAEYRRLAQVAWEKLPPRAATGKETFTYSPELSRLRAMLDYFAESDGDLDARIALRTKDLSSSWEYLQLAEFCRAHGREEEALRHAEEGLWLFEDGRLNEKLVCLAADLLLKTSRPAEAEAHLRRAFEKEASLTLHLRLRELGGEAAVRRNIAYLEEKLLQATSVAGSRPADLLVRILMEERMFAQAWSLVRTHRVSTDLKQVLAGASEALHTPEAIEAYEERVEELASFGGHQAYQDAALLIARLANLRPAEGQAVYLEALKTRHRRKRNLMKLLG